MIPGAIVTDIEGTTSSIAFVHEVLFPYSRARLADYVASHEAECAPILAEVRALAGEDSPSVALLEQWHDEDRKIGPLKVLQGLIWAEGYRSGAITGHVYADAAEGLRRWHGAGIPLYVYSSGSIAAQMLLFGHSSHGDLTPLFSGYFDTATGGKKEAASYHAIARAIGLPAGDILFLSDVAAELAAAREAGFQVLQLVRESTVAGPGFPAASDFTAILPVPA